MLLNIYFKTFLLYFVSSRILYYSIVVFYLQIHYDRVGKDGLSGYKEVTFLFLPDLENCLPSLDAWRSQWVSRRDARVEREREAMLKMEKVCDVNI